ncbi:MAG: TonB-dependent receptor plug domain-containing protein [Bacteroidales bacterium]|nr:TonB-dependent receptor plug domain-containing protein [Bacteroidales bacterium]
MKRLLIILSILFTLSVAASAQNDTIMLESVEISASLVYKKAEQKSMERKIDAAIVKSLKTISLSQLLIQHSPVFIKTYGPGGTATASFRGTTSSHTLVLWNGLQLNSPSLGEVDFSTIPVFFTDEVSLQWGSKTSANSGGLGGVVNIDNSQKFNEGLILDFRTTRGSFDAKGLYLTLGYSAKNVITRVKAYRNSSDNDFTYTNIATIPHQEMKQKNADFLDYGVMPEMQLRLKKSLLTFVSWNQLSHRNYPQIMPNVFNNTKEYVDNYFTRNFLSYKYYWNTGRVEVKLAYFHEKQDYFLESYTSNGNPVTHINTVNVSDVLRHLVDVQQDLYRSWKLYVKIQYDHEKVRSSNYSAAPDATTLSPKRKMISFYAAVDGKIYKDLDLRMTLRNDLVGRDLSTVAYDNMESVGFFPTATLTYRMPFVKGLSVNAGYSHNYRNPTLNDLYWNPGGNENLKGENGKTVDLDMNYHYDDINFNLDFRTGFYYSKVKDWIQWVPTNYRYWMPKNVSEVLARGLELHFNANYRYALWNFMISGNYVYSHTTDESEYAQQYGTDGKQLIYIPLHHANAFAEVKWKTWNLNYTFEFTGERNTSMNDDEFFAYQLPYYMLHHISFGKQLNKFRLEFRVNNLMNADYQTVLWRAMPGRSYEFYFEFKL